MARRILMWECEYCGKVKKTEKICKRHEAACLCNPDSKNCLLCKHMIDTTPKRCAVRRCFCSTAVSSNCDHYDPKDTLFNFDPAKVELDPIKVEKRKAIEF